MKRNLIVLLALALPACGILPACTGDVAGEKEPVRKKAALKEARIWYLFHSGFAVNSGKHLLIFDYCGGPPADESQGLSEGVINPEEIKDFEVLVFISHSHGDHFGREAMQWHKSVANINFIIPPCVDTFFSDKDAKAVATTIKPGEEKKVNGVEITAFKSTDQGVAFVVNVNGLVIYHAGDLALWVHSIEKQYNDEIQKVARHNVDIAFVPVHHRSVRKGAIWDGALYTVRELSPNVVFPMHSKGNYECWDEFADEVDKIQATRGEIKTQAVTAKETGKSYVYSDGKILAP
ncbi:MAG: MBL fold metallo-hydrolase [Planctomycetota bacterium]|jgi:L-ascorbate metabolism protein UlaG (beta-lactamase superfamily)